MPVTTSEIWGGIVGLILGSLSSFGIMYRFLKSRIKSEDVKKVYDNIMAAITEYKNAKEDGIITTDEQLQIAEKTLAVLESVVKSLEKSFEL